MKNMITEMPSKGEIAIYRTKGNKIQLEVKLEQETVWLTQEQISKIFNTERSVVTKHLSNIFKSKELEEKSNVQKMHIAFSDKPVKFYNLDAVISVGYRVNSLQATQFRIWATNILKRHLIDGYTLNEKRLKEQALKLQTLQRAVKLIGSMKDRKALEYKEANLYPSIEEKAANLLYFIVKNHSFVDGNKRIAASIFLWFLERNGVLYKEDGSKRIADNALVALTLMIAESRPAEREVIVTLVVNLINKNN